MTGALYKPRPDRHECRTPPCGAPTGIDPGDIWRCGCGRYWRAYHTPGSRNPITGWRRLTRFGGWLRSLGGLPVPLSPRSGDPRVPEPRTPAE